MLRCPVGTLAGAEESAGNGSAGAIAALLLLAVASGFAERAEATLASSASAYTIYYDDSGVPIAQEEDQDENFAALLTAREHLRLPAR